MMVAVTVTDIWLLFALLVLIVAAAVLGAAEASLLRVPRVRLEVAAESGDARSATMVRLLDDLPRVLNTVLLVVLLVQIGAATLAGTIAGRFFGSLGVTIVSFVLTFILFVYAEAIPKTFAVHHPESVARTTAPLLRFLSWLFRPIVSVLVKFADLQAPGIGIASSTAPTEEELLRLASEAAEIGAIDPSDHVLMDRAFELGDQRVDDVYVPRLDVVAISRTASVGEALDLAIASGHRRIPLYEGDIDNIVGVVRLTDLADAVLGGSSVRAVDLASDPLVVPESRRVIHLLGDMRDARRHFAVVVDEFGGTAGIVTIEDIVEQLLGPLAPIDAGAEDDIRRTAEGVWDVSGSADTNDLERELGRELPRGDWNTVAGLVIALAGHFPDAGETVTSGDLRFAVADTSGHRIHRVTVTEL